MRNRTCHAINACGDRLVRVHFVELCLSNELRSNCRRREGVGESAFIGGGVRSGATSWQRHHEAEVTVELTIH